MRGFLKSNEIVLLKFNSFIFYVKVPRRSGGIPQKNASVAVDLKTHHHHGKGSEKCYDVLCI